MERLLIIRGESHIRNTPESEILASLSPAEILLPRKIYDLDTLEFKNAIESGYWESLNIYLQDAAGRLLTEVNGPERTKLCYFGVEETPMTCGVFL
jgi:hypothetical protein